MRDSAFPAPFHSFAAAPLSQPDLITAPDKMSYFSIPSVSFFILQKTAVSPAAFLFAFCTPLHWRKPRNEAIFSIIAFFSVL